MGRSVRISIKLDLHLRDLRLQLQLQLLLYLCLCSYVSSTNSVSYYFSVIVVLCFVAK